MSDTPRIDAAWVHASSPRMVIEEGRRLEREMKLELERATHYRDKWQKAQERIKRLEEAGDAMAFTHLETPTYESALQDVCAWVKAKEVKP